jgi:hypothetical protein
MIGSGIMPCHRPRVFAAVQLGLVLCVLVGCLVLPRRGGSILLVPLGRGSQTALVRALGAHRFALLRSGSLPGSLLVRIDGQVPIMPLLRAGVLPLGAPEWLCSSASPATPEHG